MKNQKLISLYLRSQHKIKLSFLIAFILWNSSLFCLAPSSSFHPNQNETELGIVERLIDEDFYSHDELKFVEELGLKMVEIYTLKGQLHEFKEWSEQFWLRYKKSIQGNLSLYRIIEEMYFTYEWNDEFRDFLYELLLEITTYSVVEESRSIERPFQARKIPAYTQLGRLAHIDDALESYYRSIKGSFGYYDLASAYGTETFRTYQAIQALHVPGEVDLHCVAVDINFYQYVLYDLKNRVKIFLDAFGRPNFLMEKGQLRSIRARSIKEMYQEVFRRFADQQEKQGRFKVEDDYILEENLILDPNLKMLVAIGRASFLQHDLFDLIPGQTVRANVIRMMNILQYFKVEDQRKVLLNALNLLHSNGLLIFQIEFTSEHAPYIFVLRKISDKEVVLYKILGSGYHKEDQKRGGIQSPYLARAYTLLDSLGLIWHEEEGLPGIVSDDVTLFAA